MYSFIHVFFRPSVRPFLQIVTSKDNFYFVVFIHFKGILRRFIQADNQ